MTLTSSSVLGEVSQDPYPSGASSEISKHIFLLYTPGDFQTAASMLYLFRTLCPVISLRVGTQFPIALLALPEPCPLTFKVLSVKPH